MGQALRHRLGCAGRRERCAAQAAGRIEASDANRWPLSSGKAQAALQGKTIELEFEPRVRGYNGSTCTSRYDPARDTLQGEFFQAVARQACPVRFRRRPAR